MTDTTDDRPPMPPVPGRTLASPQDAPPVDLGAFDWNDGNDRASAFWGERHHATCMLCGSRMYRVQLTNERGTYDEFRHDGTGSVWCNPPAINGRISS